MSETDPTAPTIDLAGTHYQMGYQHGQQVAQLRPRIVAAVETRLAQIEQDRPGPAFAAMVAETARVLQTVDPATYDFIHGQADGLELDFEWLLRYDLVNFLRDALTTRTDLDSPCGEQPAEGCTAWTAAGSATLAGQPILVKNRDYRREHLALQLVARARPPGGYGYLYLTSAGNPGVFVAGINEAGLAVADTHVPCPDVGPGLPTYALSMHLLEEQSSVAGGLTYLQRVPRLGRNNLILVDATGHMAVFENGHHHYGQIEASDDFLISTNHFNTAAMKGCFVDTEPASVRGNTFHRYQKVQEVLTAARGRIDLALAQKLMATHAGSLASLCRHPRPGLTSSTIAAIVLLPLERRILVCSGQPCQGVYRAFEC